MGDKIIELEGVNEIVKQPVLNINIETEKASMSSIRRYSLTFTITFLCFPKFVLVGYVFTFLKK